VDRSTNHHHRSRFHARLSVPGAAQGLRARDSAPRPVQAAAPQPPAPQQRNYSRGDGNYSRGEGRRGWQGNQAQVDQSQAARSQAVQGQNWQGRGGNGQTWQGRGGDAQQSTLDRQGVTPSYQRRGERNQQRYGTSQAQGNWQQGRNESRYRDDRRGNDRQWNNGSGYDRYNGSRGRESYSWNRGWRNDNRYDWQHYRYSNRNLFHGGAYYAPYRNYGYNRLSIGIFLDSLFYSQNYWIGDPYQYRLPPNPPGTQWVRYYNDVVLVDVYSGEVLDTIYDFFW